MENQDRGSKIEGQRSGIEKREIEYGALVTLFFSNIGKSGKELLQCLKETIQMFCRVAHQVPQVGVVSRKLRPQTPKNPDTQGASKTQTLLRSTKKAFIMRSHSTISDRSSTPIRPPPPEKLFRGEWRHCYRPCALSLSGVQFVSRAVLRCGLLAFGILRSEAYILSSGKLRCFRLKLGLLAFGIMRKRYEAYRMFICFAFNARRCEM